MAWWESGVENLFRSRFEFALERASCVVARGLAGILSLEPSPEMREENRVGSAIELGLLMCDK